MKKIRINKQTIMGIMEQFARGILLALLSLGCIFIVSVIPVIGDYFVLSMIMWGALMGAATWATKKGEDLVCKWLDTHVILINANIKVKSR